MLALILILSLNTPAHAEIVDKIVALVDDEAITESDITKANINNRLFPVAVLQNKDQNRRTTHHYILQSLIDEKILQKEIEKSDIKISDLDVDNSIRDILVKKQMKRETLEQTLKSSGMSWNNYKESIRNNMKQEKFLQQEIYPRIRIADYDLQQYYNKNKAAYQGYGKVRFLEIFLTPESVPAGENPVDFAKKLVARLRGGESFEKLARQYSKGPFASDGGNSGLLDTTSLRGDLKELLLALKPNMVTDPMPSPDGNGIIIMKVVEKTNPMDRPLNEVKEMVRREYADEVVGNELEKFVMEARSQHFVEIRE
ncbi:MAG: hypothetical protein A2048_03450 [Deltaproteobacteria bacterium GWA2_45_12]|nr:MAG: hypothetical protein A2048_03450 [Deltaproteobacteria bacterium GWA2_45_12]